MSIESSRVFQNYDAGGARRTAEKKETGIARSGWRTFTYQPEKADSNFPPITLSKGSVLDFLERNGQGFSWWQRASNEEMSVRLRSIVAKPLPGDKGKTADEIFRRAFEGSSETSQPTSTKTSLNTRENSSGPTKKPTRARPPTGSAVQQVTSPRTPAPSTAGGPAMSSASPRASRSTVPGLRPLEMADAHRQDEALRSFQTTPSHSLLGSPSSESLDSSGSLDSTPRESDDAVVQRNPTLIGEREVLTGKLAGESSFGFRTKTGPGGQSLKPVQVEEIIRRAFNKAIIGNTGTWSPGTAKNYTGDLGEGTAAINQSRIGFLIREMRASITSEVENFVRTGSLTSTPAQPATETAAAVPTPVKAKKAPVTPYKLDENQRALKSEVESGFRLRSCPELNSRNAFQLQHGVDLLDVMIGIFASKLVGRRDIMHDTNHFHIVEAPKLYEKINYFNELQQQGNNAGIKWLKNECGALGLSFTAVVKGFKKGEDVGVTESRPIRLNTRESTEIIENI